MMCSFSGPLMLFQNSVAWEKWSPKDSLRLRILCPSTRSG